MHFGHPVRAMYPTSVYRTRDSEPLPPFFIYLFPDRDRLVGDVGCGGAKNWIWGGGVMYKGGRGFLMKYYGGRQQMDCVKWVIQTQIVRGW
eukprot:753712-Hanusia_phi.AAC.7